MELVVRDDDDEYEYDVEAGDPHTEDDDDRECGPL